MILPNVLESEYIPTARPVRNADAPKDSAYVLITGSWVKGRKRKENNSIDKFLHSSSDEIEQL